MCVLTQFLVGVLASILGGFPLGAHSPGGAGQNRPKPAPTEAIWRSLSRLGGLEVA